ncbi:PQQ-dependent sugar dehydrogenase [Oceaniglobus roseus]|uniref:PQQ-dependent sugar dehydrogenase n=1 Tax=Oceaniglobus roseus TaxID=1737570 RepID=UPI000C7F3EE6|nr:PQQ-dependent sugar dehydrogenase [Kandeliimicrobium roseum]
MTRTLSLLAATAAFPVLAMAEPVEQGPRNVPEFEPAFENQTRAPAMDSGVSLEVEEIASGLSHPWGIEVLPDGSYLVTERSGALRHVGEDGTVGEPIAGVPEVLAQDQGGLLDVALAEDFAESRTVFLTYAKPMEGGMSATAAAKGRLSEDLRELTGVTDIFVQDPPAPNAKHFGSRIVPHGDYVFITTGEHFTDRLRQYAQDLDKTYGKIVRVTLDGEAPGDNPFAGEEGARPEIWSYGHRNIQGAAIRPSTGELWGLEHGPKGGDELNRIEAGGNYGWPLVSYGEKYSGQPVGSGEHSQEGVVEPRYYWDPVIAPGGFAWMEGETFADWEGDVIAASLKPGGIVRLDLEDETVVGEERFLRDELGRVRDIEIAPDGAILAITDQDNGRLVRLTPGTQAMD